MVIYEARFTAEVQPHLYARAGWVERGEKGRAAPSAACDDTRPGALGAASGRGTRNGPALEK